MRVSAAWPCRWDRHICVRVNAGGREGAAVAILARMVYRTSAAAVPSTFVVRWLPLLSAGGFRLHGVRMCCAVRSLPGALPGYVKVAYQYGLRP